MNVRVFVNKSFRAIAIHKSYRWHFWDKIWAMNSKLQWSQVSFGKIWLLFIEKWVARLSLAEPFKLKWWDIGLDMGNNGPLLLKKESTVFKHGEKLLQIQAWQSGPWTVTKVYPWSLFRIVSFQVSNTIQKSGWPGENEVKIVCIAKPAAWCSRQNW